VLVDLPHQQAWRESLRELMEGEWSDIRDRTTWSPGAFTSQVSTGRSISMARSSTSCSRPGVTSRLRGASSPGRCAGPIPVEVTTDRAHVCPRVPGELIPSALHTAAQYADNPVKADHGRLKAQLRAMRD